MIYSLYMDYLRTFGVVVLHEGTPKKERRSLDKQFSRVKELIGLVTPVMVVMDGAPYPAVILAYADAAAALLEREDLPLDIWEVVANAEMHVEKLLAPPSEKRDVVRLRALARAYHDAATHSNS